jgi:hypothetical protein
VANKGYDEQMEDFVSALREGRPPKVGVSDGIRATIACLRLMESCQQHGAPRTINWRDFSV